MRWLGIPVSILGLSLMILFCFYFFDCAGWTRRVLGSLPCRAWGLHTESEGTCSTAWKLPRQQLWTTATVNKMQTRPQRRPGRSTSSRSCSDWRFASLICACYTLVLKSTHTTWFNVSANGAHVHSRNRYLGNVGVRGTPHLSPTPLFLTDGVSQDAFHWDGTVEKHRNVHRGGHNGSGRCSDDGDVLGLKRTLASFPSSPAAPQPPQMEQTRAGMNATFGLFTGKDAGH